MTNCKWAGSANPRVLPGRHLPECPPEATGADLSAEECSGCLPCPESHCAVCRRAHALGACPECLAATRDDLAAIRLMCGALPEEVRHRGIEGEAMMLLGPSADLEARQYVEASYLAGRLPEGWIETTHGRKCPTLRNEPCLGCGKDGEERPDGERHPLNVLGTWEMAWRDFLEHESDAKITVDGAAAYLDRQLSYMAEQDDVPFADFAGDVRRCRSHLEDVLHDGERVEKGAPCPACAERGEKARPLVQVHNDRDKTGASDRWVCQRNPEHWWPEAGYRLRIADDYRANSDKLTAPDMEAQYEVKATSVRAWASLGKVRRRGKDDSGRQLYDVADVLRQREGKTSESVA